MTQEQIEKFEQDVKDAQQVLDLAVSKDKEGSTEETKAKVASAKKALKDAKQIVKEAKVTLAEEERLAEQKLADEKAEADRVAEEEAQAKAQAQEIEEEEIEETEENKNKLQSLLDKKPEKIKISTGKHILYMLTVNLRDPDYERPEDPDKRTAGDGIFKVHVVPSRAYTIPGKYLKVLADPKCSYYESVVNGELVVKEA